MIVNYNYRHVQDFIEHIRTIPISDTTEFQKRIMGYIIYYDYEETYIKMDDIIEDMQKKGWFRVPYEVIIKKVLNKDSKYGLLGK